MYRLITGKAYKISGIESKPLGHGPIDTNYFAIIGQNCDQVRNSIEGFFPFLLRITQFILHPLALSDVSNCYYGSFIAMLVLKYVGGYLNREYGPVATFEVEFPFSSSLQ